MGSLELGGLRGRSHFLLATACIHVSKTTNIEQLRKKKITNPGSDCSCFGIFGLNSPPFPACEDAILKVIVRVVGGTIGMRSVRKRIGRGQRQQFIVKCYSKSGLLIL